MNKFGITIFTLFCFTVTTMAQRKNVYFINKEKGRYVTNKDSADYVRIVQEPDKGSKLYIVNEYYMDGKGKSYALSTTIDPPSYEGEVRTFHQNGSQESISLYKAGKKTDSSYTFHSNGNIKSKAIFSKGEMVGPLYRYFPNGQLYTITQCTWDKKSKTNKLYFSAIRDTSGRDMVVNGNGEHISYDEDFKEIIERGPIKNGYMDGTWNGATTKPVTNYTEVYAEGVLLSGKSTDENNITYTYTDGGIHPHFKGGIDNFYKYLMQNITYPTNPDGSYYIGKVFISFVIKTDGTLTDIEVTNSPHPDLAKEVVKAMKASPKWEPGVQRGRVVNVKYNIPISFKAPR